MAEENDPPPDSKLTRTKQRWAREGKFLTGKPVRPEEQRLPPGQHLTKDWPVLDLGLTPPTARERWRLDVYGAIDNPVFWTFAEFTEMYQIASDFEARVKSHFDAMIKSGMEKGLTAGYDNLEQMLASQM